MRVFFAIELEDETKQYLNYYQKIISQYSIKGNFTAFDNFHLTLKFIGEVDENKVEDLKMVIDTLAQQHNIFYLTLKNLGNFSKGNKEILWIGLQKEPLLYKLYEDLEGLTSSLGYTKENRPYRPHITLGREIVLQKNFKDLQSTIHVAPKRIKVEKISLMWSRRMEGKLVYIPLYTKQLKEGM